MSSKSSRQLLLMLSVEHEVNLKKLTHFQEKMKESINLVKGSYIKRYLSVDFTVKF